MTNIVLGVSGSVASIITGSIVESLELIGNVRVVLTDTALKLIDKAPPNIFERIEKSLAGHNKAYTDEIEWQWEKLGDPIHHVELKKWGDVLVIAPISANTLAKISAGICDNLLTCVYRAWPKDKPIVIAPAMNTDMWEHPVTEENLYTLKNRHKHNLYVVQPIVKTLVCGDTGMGALADIDSIAGVVKLALT